VAPEKFGNSPEVRRSIDEIYEYEENPVYVQESKEHWDDINQRLKICAAVFGKAKDEDPERRARNTLDSITTRYGFSESRKKGAFANQCASCDEGMADEIDVSIVAQQHSALEISDRWAELWTEHLDGVRKQRGDLVLTYFITYESQIQTNQACCRITERLQGEGLIDCNSLFPNGGNHATVRTNVEAFDRFLYSEWERSLVIKDTDKLGRKREYRRFLRDRARNWGRDYLEWLSQRDAEKRVKVDM